MAVCCIGTYPQPVDTDPDNPGTPSTLPPSVTLRPTHFQFRGQHSSEAVHNRPFLSAVGVARASMDGLRFIPPFNRGDPWFEDGNIILMVEDDNRHVLKAFKVHRGVLARQSEVFETMFDIPQPTSSADSVEHIDGCPVIRMYDLPNELSDLIKALYDGV
jgi:BTB/POZ domain